MTLSEETKNIITTEYNNFKEKMYGQHTLEERQELDQFYTPSSITIKMIESYDCDDLSEKKILDPCCGSGNLLIACLLSGADIKNIYGNEYDKDMVKLCRRRLKSVYSEYILKRELTEEENRDINILLETHIHRGNALQKRCITEFSESYRSNYNDEYIDDLDYAQGKQSWESENKEALTRVNSKHLIQEELW